MLSDTMAGTFARSYQLVKESWAILKQDKNGGDSGCLAICSMVVLMVFGIIWKSFDLRTIPTAYFIFSSSII